MEGLESHSGDQRPVSLFQMVNMMAGQSVELDHPGREVDEEDEDEGDVALHVEELFHRAVEQARNALRN